MSKLVDRIGSLPMLAKRYLNLLAIQAQYMCRTRVVRGRPYVLIIDPINICNLKCPLCPTGLGVEGRAKGRMSFDLFKRIIDELGDYAMTVVMHNWGEPMLHDEIFEMISYAGRKGAKTILSSNLNLFDEHKARRLVESGLTRLIVSLDATTSETYSKYRIGGDFDRVLENMKCLVNVKRAMGSRTPEIVWQFLVFKHNAEEVEEARRMAHEIGVDEIDVYPASLGGTDQTPYIGAANTPALIDKWLLPDGQYTGQFDYFANPEYLCDKRCYFLWNTVTINWDGSVSPCCCVHHPSTDFGNIETTPFAQIWNNEKYQDARALFGRNGGREQGGGGTICRECKVFKKPKVEEKKATS